MCGIAGYVTVAPSDLPDALLEGMTDRIAHRGPDGYGFYRDSYAALGHRRLAIVDLPAGKQPMCNENGSLWLIYNGEIFNHADLRRELERAGHQYRTRSDTETILHAYEEYGPACVSRFRGMFAFAAWDKDSRTLFCARDRMGKKPFYYYWDGRLFAFASEIKALLRHPAIGARLRRRHFDDVIVFRVMQRELDVRIADVEHTVRAERATEEDSRALGCTAGDPIVETRLVYRDERGRAVEVAFTRYPAERYSLTYSLTTRSRHG